MPVVRGRKAVVALLAAVMSGAFWIGAVPASAQCDPRKPQTCARCHIRDAYIDESGNVVITWDCY